jgi:hypothetical protein
MADREKLSERLQAREAGLSTRRAPGGGEVMSGPTASKALKTLGARAMTMDNTIFVDEGFDASRPADLALLAHEQHHQAESGGTDTDHGEYDAEEMAARARERMVLHRAGKGEDADAILSDARSGGPSTHDEVDRLIAGEDNAFDDAGRPDPIEAYRRLRKQGMPHAQVVKELADYVVQALGRQDSIQAYRRAEE